MIPELPESEIRDALARGDWQLLAELVDTHDERVRRCAAELPRSDRAGWQRLMAQHDNVIAMLRQELEITSVALRRHGQQQRGLRAYAGAAG